MPILRLAGVVAREAVTVVELVPTAIGWIVDAGVGADLSRVRCLISTGEKRDPGLARRVVAAIPDVTFMNAYGSTECSDDVALHVITEADAHRPRIVVGRPIANAVMYLLVNEDGQWHAAADDEEGELWIGGYPVGGGYHDEPELTRAAFFVDEIEVVLSRVPGMVRSAVVADRDQDRTNLTVYYVAQPHIR